jgi:hypothetical protein
MGNAKYVEMIEEVFLMESTSINKQILGANESNSHWVQCRYCRKKSEW